MSRDVQGAAGPRRVEAIDILADRAAERAPDEGFLHLRRLRLRNRYADGSSSPDYDCDMVSRADVDAVAVVSYQRMADGTVRVALRENVRPPLAFRDAKRIPHAEARPDPMVLEVVAGVLEPEDAGPEGVERRAALECAEEAGLTVRAEDVRPLGAPLFASPGISDERVHYRCVEADLDARQAPAGDGSVMEEAGGVVVLDLAEALARCRDGRVPDAKTEVALARLRDRLHPDPPRVR